MTVTDHQSWYRRYRQTRGKAIAAALFCMTLASASRAAERILLFQSEIQVHSNSTLTVTETIQVRADGKKIRRGIYRDFPTRYRDQTGQSRNIGFNVVAVNRNGKPEPYRMERLANGERVRIGRKNVFLEPGVYTYAIAYETTRQLGFFQEHDELYWNVTGNDWDFPIDKAIATVALPKGMPSARMTLAGYTGPQGSRSTNLQSRLTSEGQASFTTTRKLGRHEGLTIVVGWPKGYVYEPTRAERLLSVLVDNPTFLVALAGLVGMLVYYSLAWLALGRDPEKGTIIPRFAPPQQISPAAARYVFKMGYDHRCFAAALINLAVRRYVKLVDNDGEFTVQHLGEGDSPISSGESKVLEKLLGSRQSLTLKQTHHTRIRAATEGLQDALKHEHQKQHFVTNRAYLVPGGILAILTIIGVVIASGSPEIAFFAVWLSIWSLAVAAMLKQIVSQWRAVITRPRLGQTAGALFLTLFATPFVAAEIFVGCMFARSTSVATVLAMITMIPATFCFHHLLKAPTRQGRKLMDAIEGFRQYLSVAEEDRLAALHPLKKTPELFEAYLPYALALGVEQEWAERFAGVLEAAGQGHNKPGYRPSWYDGMGARLGGPSGLAASVGSSLASAVAASSTAPGSRSGGGGGGSSGGGGGGGGGGGW